MPEISIIMPVFNAENYLRDCIESVLLQKNKDWELIAVDDFSTDRSFEILQTYQAKSARIRVFENNQKGIIPALKLGFSNAQGKFITRMDADDIMPVDKLNCFYQQISAAPPKTIVTGRVQYFSDSTVSEGYRRYENWLNERVIKNDFWKQIYRECVVASPNWMVHRQCFEEDVLLDRLIYPEDYDMVFQWYKNGYEVLCVNECTHLWREHSQRTSRNDANYQQEAFFKLKTDYFARLQLSPGEEVQVAGISKKGQLVAKYLAEHGVAFSRFEYGRSLDRSTSLPVEELNSDKKLILTNWPINEKEQHEIKRFLHEKGFEIGLNCWVF